MNSKPSSTSKTAKTNLGQDRKTFQKKFYKEVLIALGEMLKVLKQGDKQEHRRQLQEYCQNLYNLSREAHCPQWMELLSAAQLAIADPQNAYEGTIKQIIKDIKAAGELTRTNQLEGIEISETLRAIASRSSATVADFNYGADAQTWQIYPTAVEEPTSIDNDYWLEESRHQQTAHEQTEIYEPNPIQEFVSETPTVSDNALDFIADWLAESNEENNNGELSTQPLVSPDEEIEELLDISETEQEEVPQEESDDLLKLFLEVIEPDDTTLLETPAAEADDLAELLGLDDCVSASLAGSAFSRRAILSRMSHPGNSGRRGTDDSKDALQEQLEELAPMLDFEDSEEIASVEIESSSLSNDWTTELFDELAEPPQDVPLIYYRSFESLEHLLEESPLASTRLSFEQLEAMLDASGTTPATTPAITELETALDEEFRELEQLLKQTEPASVGSATLKAVSRQGASSRAASSNLFEQTMRVPVKQLDNFNNLIGELVVNRNTLEQDQERLRQFLDNLLNQVQSLSDIGGRMQDLYERTLLEGALLASRSQPSANNDSSFEESKELDALELDRFTGFHLLSQEIIELIVRVRESASDVQFLVDETDQVARTLRQITTHLQEGLNTSRMIPFAQAADRLPRAVREISRRLNKQAQLIVEGREVLVDKMILEQLYDPMTHLVNNAITHGIESPEIRLAQGKPAAGCLTVSAFLQGNQTVISVADDGAGINPERVKTKAIEKGLITKAEAKTLSNQDVYDFLFHPGFSTKEKADDFAGRGVGLDVVRTSLDAVRGSVSIDSTLGQGTTFTIRLPLTLSISKALCCLSDRSRIAFPMDGVEDMQDFRPDKIQTMPDGKKGVLWRNTLLPLRPLSELLSYNRQISRGNVYGGKQEDDTTSIVVLRGAGNFLAVQIDQVLGEQEIVIKQIEGPVPKPAGIAGATVLGDGSVMPIGDVLELIEIAQGRMRTDSSSHLWQRTAIHLKQKQSQAAKEPLVLIVDDSITVRELLSISFGKVGYRVEQARDGQEAWEKLRSGLPCDIMFCDIEMPRMNGLELLARLRKVEQFAQLPVAMLTSRGAAKHRKLASDLGASGYFTKPYTERDLLDAAKRMLGGEVLIPNRKTIVEELPEETPTAVSQPIRTKTGNTVLVVDDSVMVREMLSMTFSKAGYRVEQARDGQEAWEKLRAGLACELILCDIEMPRMNGLELLSLLQEDDNLSTIPIAMITSRGAERHRRIAATRGARAYFTKPYIEDVLLDSAQRLINGEILLENSKS